MTRKQRKRKTSEVLEKIEQKKLPPITRNSDEPPPKKEKWINRQRVLVFAARGIIQRDRHLMKDLKAIMPHSKDENKMERREQLSVINEICTMKNCNKAVFFEGRKKKDLFMWISNVPEGPSAKFLVESVYTMGELKLTGNCLKGSRPLLSFDDNFNALPHYALLKELFIQIFGVPNHHPKSQPFFDKVITFTAMDNRIWFRNYQILKEDGALAEIGPRLVLNPIKIFEGSFSGATIWHNPKYISPSLHRIRMKQAAAGKYVQRKSQKEQYKERRPEVSYPENPMVDVFQEDTFELASKIAGKEIPDEDKQPQMSLAKRKKKRAGQKVKKNKVSL